MNWRRRKPEPMTPATYSDLFHQWEAQQAQLREAPAPAPEIIAAELLECCDHPADVHSDPGGCWLCPCQPT